MTKQSIKELALWLKESVEFLQSNQDYSGVWKLLDDHYAAVVLWEEGWGDEERDDVIQAEESKDWGICAGIKVYNSDSDYIEDWFYPWADEEEGALLVESVGVRPDEDYESLAKGLLDSYGETLEGTVPEENGQVNYVMVDLLPEPEEAEPAEEPEEL